jgi:ABC-2 type transport system ATP-binding protein
MINVEHLTKKYPGGVTAVEDVSFSVDEGELMGFLGPNGAGKTTTMRILSGFLSLSGGRVLVDGLDVSRQGLEVRSRIGYLPETCPLYTDMRVWEYLKYRAELKGVARRHRKTALDRVLEECGLEGVRNKLIDHLSKGYRQRVGIADAMIHQPRLLILDEPTIGLDPNQIVEIRHLIKRLSQNHTVLISSHILSEIEATCDRVIVLSGGRILETASLSELEQRWFPGSDIRVEVRGDIEEVRSRLLDLENVNTLRIHPDGDWLTLQLTFSGNEDPREQVYTCLKDADIPLRELHRIRHSLEEAFVNMTSGGGRT